MWRNLKVAQIILHELEHAYQSKVFDENKIYECSNLASITIPNSVTSIEGDAFNRTKNLESINYLGTKAQWEKVKLGPFWRKGSYLERIECRDGIIELE